jgi:hypothetical protein
VSEFGFREHDVDLLVAGAAEQNDRVTFGAGEIPGADPLVQGSRDKMVPGEGDTTRPQRAQQASFIGIDSAMSPLRLQWIFSIGFRRSLPVEKRRALRVEASAVYNQGKK